MPPTASLQTATGGSPLVVVLALFGLLVTAGLSLAVAYLVIRGYRRNRDRAQLFLALGLVLLTTVPIVAQLLLSNLTTVSMVGRAATANASKLLGLGAILYAIYGAPHPPRTGSPGDSDERNRAKALLPLAELPGVIADAEELVFAFAAATAVAGSFVAYQAYRGYRRNESRPMLYLAVGIALLTAVPVGVDYALVWLTAATVAETLLAVTVAHLAGVVSVLYALTRA